uniref:Uncharacterized protein n=1 Tax=Gallus gallus TaxID=9031 RepID=A0A8V0ZYQ6_CHICK
CPRSAAERGAWLLPGGRPQNATPLLLQQTCRVSPYSSSNICQSLGFSSNMRHFATTWGCCQEEAELRGHGAHIQTLCDNQMGHRHVCISF